MSDNRINRTASLICLFIALCVLVKAFIYQDCITLIIAHAFTASCAANWALLASIERPIK